MSGVNPRTLAELVRSVLERAASFQWTVQGFGMLRTKLADVGRIHIWDSRLRVPLVSDIHAHPWSLRSHIVSGELLNQRFSEAGGSKGYLPYMRSIIATGEGGGLVGQPREVWLAAHETEFYTAGSTYDQRAEEIHRSIPIDGTVTVLERQMGPPLEETLVYWPRGTNWVSAEPRPATAAEVARSVQYALARWSAGS